MTQQETQHIQKKKSNVRDWKVIRQSANLSALPCHLHLLLGISVLLKLVDLWNNIEWERMSKDCILGFTPLQVHSRSVQQFIHALLTSPRCGLIGGHDNFLEAKEFVQWPQSHETNGSGAIGIGNELLALGALSIDFRNDQWDVWKVSKGGLEWGSQSNL